MRRSSLASLAFLAALAAFPFSVVGLGGCMSNADGDDTNESSNDLTERSDALVLAAANTLDEDTLDLEVGLGPEVARTIVTRRPFRKTETLRAFLSPRQIRLLLTYAQTNGLSPSPSGSASASAYASGSASAYPSWDASPYPSGSASSYYPHDAGGQ